MTINSVIPAGPVLPAAGEVYEQEYMNRLVRALEQQLLRIANPGIVQRSALLLTGQNLPDNLKSPLNISNLPTSAVGLNAGDLWNNAGTIKVA